MPLCSPFITHTPPRTLVVGSARCVREAWDRLLDTGDAAVPVGVVPARRFDAHAIAELDVPLLTDCDGLDDAIRAHHIDLVLVATPAAMHVLTSELTTIAERAGARAQWTPPMSDVLASRTGRAPGGLDLAALIGREPRPIDDTLVREVVGGKRVLITGAGGSIGSEIARIVSTHDASEVILMDRSENALFEIDRELKGPHRPMLHDVVEAERTLRLMGELKPDVVFHAAAHKHVPMMEDHPGAALTNNLFGTKAVLDGALANGCERFVFVSTDKAVRPTSVMGATKRLAELYVRSLASETTTRCSIVRFGNVLGSACSVIPIWDAQLAQGGPLTLTDERMTRYFMTIPEAASLVIQSSAIGDGRDASVFVLDMGEPIRILDLAHRLLQQRGLDATSAIEIEVTGIRPGEKLYEELAYPSEDLVPTSVPGVNSWSGEVPGNAAFERTLRVLDDVRNDTDPGVIVASIRDAVPEMSVNTGVARTPKVVCQTDQIPNTPRTRPTHAA